MLLVNREDAGSRLAGRLTRYRDDPSALILALPRGGVPVGYAISLALHLPLDVFITRKLGAPENPEFAIGAVAETGNVFFNPQARDILEDVRARPGRLEALIERERQEIGRRQTAYRGGRALPPLEKRTVILVDDGVATGATYFASVEALNQQHLGRLVAAVPVGPRETLRRLQNLVDELVVLQTPEPFWAVGNHYEEFAQVSDEEVRDDLKRAAAALDGHGSKGRVATA
jgi:predicted phosphoribosyltransferase